jgi:hypothetical protein
MPYQTMHMLGAIRNVRKEQNFCTCQGGAPVYCNSNEETPFLALAIEKLLSSVPLMEKLPFI